MTRSRTRSSSCPGPRPWTTGERRDEPRSRGSGGSPPRPTSRRSGQPRDREAAGRGQRASAALGGAGTARGAQIGSPPSADLISAELALAAFGLLSALSWGMADFSGGIASRRSPALAVVLFSQALGGLIVLVAASRRGELGVPPRTI